MGALTLAALFLTGCGKDPGPEKGYGLFVWDENMVLDGAFAQMDEVIQKQDIDALYQVLSEKMPGSSNLDNYVDHFTKKGTDIYGLAGQPEWGLEEDGFSLKNEMEMIDDANRLLKTKGRIKGIVADVEPYLLDQWDGTDGEREELMETYARGLTEAYKEAREKGLEMLVCIPTFYDHTNPRVLEQIVKEGCDGIAVMNYNRADEYGQMETEVELAEKYGKKVICIYELQEPGKHDLEDINTYYLEGLDELEESRTDLEERFGYEGLSFALHYYEPLKELLDKEE